MSFGRITMKNLSKNRFSLNLIFIVLILHFIAGKGVSAYELTITNPRDTTMECDYLVITTDSLATVTEKLVLYRERTYADNASASNLALSPFFPKMITLSTVYREFGSPDQEPQCLAIGKLLNYAYLHWTRRPRYIVLFGDDHFEDDSSQVNRLSISRVPTFWLPDVFDGNDTVARVVKKLFSDHFYCYAPARQDTTYSKDFLSMISERPFYIVGRIPCENIGQADTYIKKLQAFEDAQGCYKRDNTIVYLADNMYSGSTEKDYDLDNIEDLSERSTIGWFKQKVYASTFAPDHEGQSSDARSAYLNAMRKNPLWSVYMGHGYPSGLSSESLLRIEDMDSIGRFVDPYIFLSMACSNAAYQKPFEQSMCKHGLFSSRGPVVYIGGIDIVYFNEMELFARNILNKCHPYSWITPGAKTFIGDAFTNVMYGFGKYSRYSYTFLGDPFIKTVKNAKGVMNIINVDITSENAGNNHTSFTTAMDRADVSYFIEILRCDSIGHVQGHSATDTGNHVFTIQDTILIDTSGIYRGPVTITAPPVGFNETVKIVVYACSEGYEGRAELKVRTGSDAVFPPLFTKSPAIQVRVNQYNGYIVITGLSCRSTYQLISIVDPGGRIVFRKRMGVENGRLVISEPLLSNGFYILQIGDSPVNRSGLLRIGRH